MAVLEATIYWNECKTCEYLYSYDCVPTYCYNCGDYFCPKNQHICNPKRVKSHYGALEAANKRGENPRLNKPDYSKQLSDGFKMVNQDYQYG